MTSLDHRGTYTSKNRSSLFRTWLHKLEVVCSKLSVLCLVCIVILWLGIWPLGFHPENQAHWLHDQRGIQFHKQGISSKSLGRGIVYSPEKIDLGLRPSAHGPATIEIWVEPKSEGSDGLGHILSFYDGESQEPLIIAQWMSYLVIRSRVTGPGSQNQYREIDLRDGLRENTRSLITVASGKGIAEIFVNGELAKSISKASVLGLNHIVGQLVLGNSHKGENPWHGNLYGLAIYDNRLTPEQVRQNYKNWTQDANAPIEAKNNPAIMYTFDEQDGSEVRNLVEDKNHLLLPSTFAPLKKNVTKTTFCSHQLSRL